jgi:cysteine desulfurase
MSSAARIYMDWNATAPLRDCVRQSLIASLDQFGNPSSVHKEGRAIRASIEAARRDVASVTGGAPANVVFTSGATEAANLVLCPDYKMGRAPIKVSKLYHSAIEHPAIREGGRFNKADLVEVPVTKDGLIDLSALEALLANHDASEGMAMVACMLVNNETGVVQPIAEVAKLVSAARGILVVDAVQALGRIPVDINALGADFVIVSSHKIGGPKGIGALITKGEVFMPKPLIHGGGQEKGHRSGTENVPAIIGFGVAAADLLESGEAEVLRQSALQARLEAGMRAAASDVVIHGADVSRVCNTTFFTLPSLKAETGQIAFDLEGIALSAGSACSSGKVGESHVLTAMGLDAKTGGLRVSIGLATTEQEIDRTIAAFAKIAGRRKNVGEAA